MDEEISPIPFLPTMSNATVVTVDGFPVLNPFASSVFLPAQVAYEEEISRYILVGASGAFVWDILNNVRMDCIFVARHTRLRLPIVIYFLSKLFSLGFVVFSAVLRTAPLSNCFYSVKALAVIFSVAVPSTALLFFFRARAVFGGNKFAVGFFGFLWLAVLAGSLTTIPGLTGVNIGPTPYCTIGGVKTYSSAGAVTPLINDSIIFFAISWRLWHNSWADRTLKNGVRSMVFGDYLPSFSKSLLQDGQVYFLTTVAANLLTVAMTYATSLPGSYRTMFTVPNTALMNIMACRVYRRMLLGDFKDKEGSFTHSHSNLAVIPPTLVGDSIASRTKHGVDLTTDNLTVNVSKTVDSMV